MYACFFCPKSGLDKLKAMKVDGESGCYCHDSRYCFVRLFVLQLPRHCCSCCALADVATHTPGYSTCCADSKKLTEEQREAAFESFMQQKDSFG